MKRWTLSKTKTMAYTGPHNQFAKFERIFNKLCTMRCWNCSVAV